MTYTTITFYSACLFYPAILDLIIPLNESHIRLTYYFTTFSHDQTIYLDILCFDVTFITTFELLSITCSESITGICTYYICMLLKILK